MQPHSPLFELTGRWALVCGSSQGIGRACAELLARQGADVTLIARDEARLQAAAREIAAATDRRADFICADFRDPSGVREKVAQYIGANGPFQILVNNTGGPPSGPLLDAKPEELLQAVTMHVVCNHVLVQALVPGMKQSGYGRIVNIVSTSVREPIPGLGVSNTTRAAVAAWAKTLSRELAPLGITINNVLPGYTGTARLRSLFEARAAREGRGVEAIEAEARASVPLGRFARPEEIAAAVVFLASPAASYITGVSLAVDGGRIASI